MDKSVTLKACPVEQVDRDAAAQWLRSVHSIYLALWIEGTGESPEWAESPNRDDYSLVQAFARHRSEAQATGLGEADIAMLGARMVLENKEVNATGCLAKTEFRPERAHLEGMRNTMREAIEYIDEARATLAQQGGEGG